MPNITTNTLFLSHTHTNSPRKTIQKAYLLFMFYIVRVVPIFYSLLSTQFCK